MQLAAISLGVDVSGEHHIAVRSSILVSRAGGEGGAVDVIQALRSE
jgi:hypothetical protein